MYIQKIYNKVDTLKINIREIENEIDVNHSSHIK